MRRLALIVVLPLVMLGAPASAQDAHAGHGAHVAASAFTSDRISVEVVGSGPDVVLIPGLASSPEVWRSTIAALPGYRYHLIHVRGFGGLAPGANSTGPVVSPVADEIARYIQERDLTRPALVGHSLGGTLAMMVATRNPDSVGRLMVVDMLPALGQMFAGPGAPPERTRGIAEQMRSRMLAATPDQRRAETEQALSSMIRTESMRPAAIAESLASDQSVSAQAMYDLLSTDLSTDLARFTGPFRVLWVVPAGAPVTEEMMAMFYRRAYGAAVQAEVEFIPDSAHVIMWDAPQRFQSELREFLEAQ